MQVRNNLHMVFTASPVGANFRVRSQRFLATINSTVIDWFQPWPEASLHRSVITNICPSMHAMDSTWSLAFACHPLIVYWHTVVLLETEPAVSALPVLGPLLCMLSHAIYLVMQCGQEVFG